MEIIKGKKNTPWFITIYGVPGVGKSTLASYSPNPLFLNIENGLERIGVDRTPHIKTWHGFVDAMKYAKESNYGTVCVDTASSLEDILIGEILAEINKNKEASEHTKTISEIPYGQGGVILKAKWSYVLMMFEKLRDVGKNVILIAHETVQKFQNPEGDDYDRFAPLIHRKSVDHVVSQMDGVFFCKYDRIMRQKEGPMNKKINYAQDTGQRVIQTCEKVTALAKNRFGMPAKLKFNSEDDFKKFFSYVV